MGTPHVRTGLGIWVWVGWKPRTALRNVRLWRHLMISPIDVFSLAFPPGLSVPVVYNRSKPPAPVWNESTTSRGFVCSSVCCSWRRPIVRTGTSGDDDPAFAAGEPTVSYRALWWAGRALLRAQGTHGHLRSNNRPRYHWLRESCLGPTLKGRTRSAHSLTGRLTVLSCKWSRRTLTLEGRLCYAGGNVSIPSRTSPTQPKAQTFPSSTWNIIEASDNCQIDSTKLDLINTQTVESSTFLPREIVLTGQERQW